jgi:hypothetical protein
MHDHQAILDVLKDYFHGIFSGDVALLKSTFHPNATLFGEVKGQPYQKSVDDYLAIVANRQSPAQLGETFQMKPLAIEILDNIAFAKTRCRMLGFNYFDYLALLRHEGRWQIVNKLFTHVTD